MRKSNNSAITGTSKTVNQKYQVVIRLQNTQYTFSCTSSWGYIKHNIDLIVRLETSYKNLYVVHLNMRHRAIPCSFSYLTWVRSVCMASKQLLYLSPCFTQSRIEKEEKKPAGNAPTHTQLVPYGDRWRRHEEPDVHGNDDAWVRHGSYVPKSKHSARIILSTHTCPGGNGKEDEGLVQSEEKPHK